MDYFSNPLVGMRWFAIGFGVLILCTSVIPAIFLKEKAETSLAKDKKIPLLRSFKETLQCKPFMILIFIMVFGGLAGNIFSNLGLYAQIYLLYDGDTMAGAILAGWISIVWQICYITSIPIGERLFRRFGKIQLFIWVNALTFVGGLTKIWLYNPDYPYLVLLIPVLMAPGFAVTSYLFPSMMADVCNYDELHTGERREGMFGATGAWFYKVAFSFSGVLSGLLLVTIGFDEQLGGNQSTTTLFWLLYGMVLGSCLSPAIGIICLLRYPLTEKVMTECSRILGERRDELT